ncbi:MAG: hypothetical protein V1859_09580 [archaeon]
MNRNYMIIIGLSFILLSFFTAYKVNEADILSNNYVELYFDNVSQINYSTKWNVTQTGTFVVANNKNIAFSDFYFVDKETFYDTRIESQRIAEGVISVKPFTNEKINFSFQTVPNNRTSKVIVRLANSGYKIYFWFFPYDKKFERTYLCGIDVTDIDWNNQEALDYKTKKALEECLKND